MFVKDVMTRDPATVSSDTTIKQAARVLTDRAISSLPVLDQDGHLCGVVSEADVLRDAFPPDPRSHLSPRQSDIRSLSRLVSEVMTPHAMTAHETTDVAEAAELMTSTGVKSLPVVDDRGRLVGVVSRSDLVRVRARADEVIEREVDALLVSLGWTDWLVAVSDGVVGIQGPQTSSEHSMAEVAAASVGGVVSVEIG